MRSESFQQYSIVKCDSPQLFTDQLNAELKRLKYNHPTVKFSEHDTLCAYISYTEYVHIAEDLGDEYELEGVRIVCEQCPLFDPIRNKDGSLNQVVKYGDCPYSQYGRTYKTTRACDILYQMISRGEVKLCFTESE